MACRATHHPSTAASLAPPHDTTTFPAPSAYVALAAAAHRTRRRLAPPPARLDLRPRIRAHAGLLSTGILMRSIIAYAGPTVLGAKMRLLAGSARRSLTRSTRAERLCVELHCVRPAVHHVLHPEIPCASSLRLGLHILRSMRRSSTHPWPPISCADIECMIFAWATKKCTRGSTYRGPAPAPSFLLSPRLRPDHYPHHLPPPQCPPNPNPLYSPASSRLTNFALYRLPQLAPSSTATLNAPPPRPSHRPVAPGSHSASKPRFEAIAAMLDPVRAVPTSTRHNPFEFDDRSMSNAPYNAIARAHRFAALLSLTGSIPGIR
ncbi:hypothetical protein B0H14DRAFT_1341136 [Mycena olivaceomarginata]|nr:hypothetical protein B0H14DRAFT_1341136 [Mycena olivaceomarginata]